MSARSLKLKNTAPIVTTALGILVAVALWLRASSQPRVPVYEGRSLTVWVEELVPAYPVETRARARAAIRSIGTNAIPLLLSYISKTDKYRFEVLRQKWGAWTKRPVLAEPIFLRVRAVSGFQALGALGHSASPQLRRLMADKELAYDAARALGAMNAPGSFPLFIECLDSPEPQRRSAGAAGLGEMGPAAHEGVLKLCNLVLRDKDETVRASAADASSTVGPAEAVIPTLVEALEKDHSETVRVCVVSALRRFPNDAKAIEAIQKAASNDESRKVRGVAASLLRKTSETLPAKNAASVPGGDIKPE